MTDSPTNTIPRGLQQILSNRSARERPWPSSLFDGHRGVGVSLPSAAPRTPGRGRQTAGSRLRAPKFLSCSATPPTSSVRSLVHPPDQGGIQNPGVLQYLALLEVTEQARISPRTTDTFRLKGIDVSGPIDRTRLRRTQRRSTREPPQSRRLHHDAHHATLTLDRYAPEKLPASSWAAILDHHARAPH